MRESAIDRAIRELKTERAAIDRAIEKLEGQQPKPRKTTRPRTLAAAVGAEREKDIAGA